MELITHIKSLYRARRGAKLENLMARSRRDLLADLAMLSERWSEELVLAGIEAYLNDDSPYLRSHKWPFYLFMARADHYIRMAMNGTAAETEREPQPEPEPVRAQSVINHVAERHDPATVYETLAHEWKRQSGEDAPAVRAPHWDEHLRSPQFVEHLRDIVRKAVRVKRGMIPKASIPWLFWGKKAPNWVRLISGDYDWAMDGDDSTVSVDHWAWRDCVRSRYREIVRNCGDRGRELADSVLAEYGLDVDDPVTAENRDIWERAAEDLLDKVMAPLGLVRNIDLDAMARSVSYSSGE